MAKRAVSPLRKVSLSERRDLDLKKLQDWLLDLLDVEDQAKNPPVPRGIQRVEAGPELPPARGPHAPGLLEEMARTRGLPREEVRRMAETEVGPETPGQQFRIPYFDPRAKRLAELAMRPGQAAAGLTESLLGDVGFTPLGWKPDVLERRVGQTRSPAQQRVVDAIKAGKSPREILGLVVRQQEEEPNLLLQIIVDPLNLLPVVGFVGADKYVKAVKALRNFFFPGGPVEARVAAQAGYVKLPIGKLPRADEKRVAANLADIAETEQRRASVLAEFERVRAKDPHATVLNDLAGDAKTLWEKAQALKDEVAKIADKQAKKPIATAKVAVKGSDEGSPERIHYLEDLLERRRRVGEPAELARIEKELAKQRLLVEPVPAVAPEVAAPSGGIDLGKRPQVSQEVLPIYERVVQKLPAEVRMDIDNVVRIRMGEFKETGQLSETVMLAGKNVEINLERGAANLEDGLLHELLVAWQLKHPSLTEGHSILAIDSTARTMLQRLKAGRPLTEAVGAVPPRVTRPAAPVKSVAPAVEEAVEEVRQSRRAAHAAPTPEAGARVDAATEAFGNVKPVDAAEVKVSEFPAGSPEWFAALNESAGVERWTAYDAALDVSSPAALRMAEDVAFENPVPPRWLERMRAGKPDISAETKAYVQKWLKSPPSTENIADILTPAEHARWLERQGLPVPADIAEAAAKAGAPPKSPLPPALDVPSPLTPERQLVHPDYFVAGPPGLTPSELASRMAKLPFGRALAVTFNPRGTWLHKPIGRHMFAWLDGVRVAEEGALAARNKAQQVIHLNPEAKRLNEFTKVGDNYVLKAWGQPVNDVLENYLDPALRLTNAEKAAAKEILDMQHELAVQLNEKLLPLLKETMPEALYKEIVTELLELDFPYGGWFGRIMKYSRDSLQPYAQVTRPFKATPGSLRERVLETAMDTMEHGYNLEYDIADHVMMSTYSIGQWGQDLILRARMASTLTTLDSLLPTAWRGRLAGKTFKDIKEVLETIAADDPLTADMLKDRVGKLVNVNIPQAPFMDTLFTDPREAKFVVNMLGKRGVQSALNPLTIVNNIIKIPLLGFDAAMWLTVHAAITFAGLFERQFLKGTAQGFLGSFRSLFDDRVLARMFTDTARVREMAQHGAGIKSAAIRRISESGSDIMVATEAWSQTGRWLRKKVAGSSSQGLVTTPLRDILVGAFTKIPQKTQMFFDIAGDIVRYYAWPVFRAGAKNPEELRAASDALMKFTGFLDVTRLGVGSTQRAIEGLAFLAPRFTRATFGTLTDVFRGGISSRLAIRTLSQMAVGMQVAFVSSSLIYWMSRTGDVDRAIDETRARMLPLHRDPATGKLTYNYRFMSLPVGGYDISFFGGPYLSIAGFVARAVATSVENPKAWLSYTGNPLIRWWRYRQSPVLRMVEEGVAHRTVIGENLDSPSSWLRWMASNVSPIATHVFIEQRSELDDTPWWGTGLAFGAEFLGGRAYEQRASHRRAALRDDLVRENIELIKTHLTPDQKLRADRGQLTWYELPSLARDKLEDKFPALEELTRAVESDIDRMGSRMARLSSEFRKTRNDIAKDTNAQLLTLQTQVTGYGGSRLSPKHARLLIGEILDGQRTRYSALYDDEKYAEVIAEREKFFSEQEPLSEADAAIDFVFDNLLSHNYLLEVEGQTLPIFLSGDWRANENYVISVLGKETYEKARDDITELKDRPELYRDYVKAQVALRPYFEAWQYAVDKDDKPYYAEYQWLRENAQPVDAEAYRAEHADVFRHGDRLIDRFRVNLRRDYARIDEALVTWYGAVPAR